VVAHTPVGLLVALAVQQVDGSVDGDDDYCPVSLKCALPAASLSGRRALR